MQRRTWLSGTIVVGLALSLLGCNGGGGGGKKTGNPAIDALLGTFYASVRAGGSTIDSTITDGTIDNPMEFPPSRTDPNLSINGNGDDNGDVDAVDVTSTVSTNTKTGAYDVTVEVKDSTTAFKFLTLTGTCGSVGISVRVPQYGFAGLSPATGTGTAYVIFRFTQSCKLSRTFENTNAGGKTLVDPLSLTQAPAMNASASLEFIEEYLATFEITLVNGQPTARLKSLADYNAMAKFARSGGPKTNFLDYAFSSFKVGTTALSVPRDPAIAVGGDWNTTPGNFQNMDAFELQGTITGGISGVSTIFSELAGALGTSPQNDTDANLSFVNAIEISDASEINNNQIELSAITLVSASEESMPSLTHELDDSGAFDDTLELSLDEVLYLPSLTQTQKVFILVH